SSSFLRFYLRIGVCQVYNCPLGGKYVLDVPDSATVRQESMTGRLQFCVGDGVRKVRISLGVNRALGQIVLTEFSVEIPESTTAPPGWTREVPLLCPPIGPGGKPRLDRGY